VSSIGWSKFYRNLRVELARKPAERTPVSKLLKHNKEEYDRLMEAGPEIPEEIITMFKQAFMGEKKEEYFTSCKDCFDKCCCIKRKKHSNEYLEHMREIANTRSKIFKPEVCDVLISTNDCKYKYVDGKDYMTKNKVLELIEHEKKRSVDYKNERDSIDNFKYKFSLLKSREPTEQEIIDNLKDTINPEVIKKVLIGEMYECTTTHNPIHIMNNIEREYHRQLKIREMGKISNSESSSDSYTKQSDTVNIIIKDLSGNQIN